MGKKRAKYDPGLKSRLAVEALKKRYATTEIASNFQLEPALIRAWKKQFCEAVGVFFEEKCDARTDRQDVETLERRLEELRREQEWMMKLALDYIDLHTRRSMVGNDESDLSVLSQSRLLGLHRSGVYYQRNKLGWEKDSETGEVE